MRGAARATEDEIRGVWWHLRQEGPVTVNRLRSTIGGGNANRYQMLIAKWEAEEAELRERAEAGIKAHTLYVTVLEEVWETITDELPFVHIDYLEAAADKIAAAVLLKLIKEGKAEPITLPDQPAEPDEAQDPTDTTTNTERGEIPNEGW